MHGSHQKRIQICKMLIPASSFILLTHSAKDWYVLKGCVGFTRPFVCVDSVHARDSADSHVNATGPHGPVEPAGPHPLCHTDHGHCLGKRRIFHLLQMLIIFWTVIKLFFLFFYVYRCAKGSIDDIVTRPLGGVGSST